MYDDSSAPVKGSVVAGPEDRRHTLYDLGAARIASLCDALGLEARQPEVLRVFAGLLGVYGGRDVDEAPSWPSDVCDDHSPFEFSISWSRSTTDLRILVETIGDPPTLRTLQEAGAAASEALANELGVSMDRLRSVEDLFTTEDPSGLFSRWHGVDFRPGRSPEVKVYLNPRIHQPVNAAAVMEAAFERLGMADAWGRVAQFAARGDRDELKYFSLDLGRHDAPRVKVYVRHHEATCQDLEAALESCRGYAAGDVTTMCRALLGGEGPFVSRPLFSCLSWVDSAEAPLATTYLPIAGYVSDDREAFHRVRDFMLGAGLPAASYDRALRAFANRPLEDGVGMQSYVSFKREGDSPRMTVYLGPEVYQARLPNVVSTQPASESRRA